LINNKAEIYLYPNPITGTTTLTLNKPQESKIELLDTQGRLLQTWTNNTKETQINITQPKGLYLLKVTTEKGQSTHKIVRE